MALKPKDAPDLGRFDWEDAFRLDDQLTEEERMMRDGARAYAQEKLQPRVIAAYREETTDPAIFREMGEMGLLGVTVPEEYGGLGASYVAYGLVAREVERVDSGYRSMMSVQSSLVMYPIYAYGSEEQRKKYLPKLASGELIGCFGLTEPDAGSDPAGMKTVAEQNRERLCADRREDVDLQCADRRCLRRLGEVRGAWRQDPRLRARKGHEGPVGAEDRRQAVALRASITGEIVMKDVEVGEDALLPNVEGLKGPFGCLNRARYGISWGVMGAAEFCWHAARQYGLDRKQFGKPLAQTQLFQKKLADMQTEISLGLQAACGSAG